MQPRNVMDKLISREEDISDTMGKIRRAQEGAWELSDGRSISISAYEGSEGAHVEGDYINFILDKDLRPHVSDLLEMEIPSPLIIGSRIDQVKVICEVQ